VSIKVRCRSCQTILAGWLPLPDVPDGALRRHHLVARHLAAATPLLRRMATEDIGTVAMEAFEWIEGDPPSA
jgi:hypothetical protein